ncbi:DUF624 domain-containing protein [Halobacillus salinarum]|uniref:DUF624 domain-containing protein n=1 Tax=Halobacillus salinarum TaxID=2932257 RepID=A0ABY4EMD5_9BACI|nr:DUF624 domain-containing protein [Halobacillus salinarum]UOQ44819.1 DUF624 domain-containing protein [Halobacillus salinarum]
MNHSSGIQGGIYAVSVWIMRFGLTNLQWTAFNVPVAVIVLSMVYAKQAADFVYLVPPLLLLLPVLFFPATSAMFAKAREWIRKEEANERSYFSYYKENYKQSLFGGLIFTVLWTILVTDIYYFSTTNVTLMNVFFILGILLFVFTVNFFNVLVHFDMKLKGVLKQAFLTTIVSPVLFIAIAFCSAVILYISVYIFPLMVPIFSGTIISFLAFSAFYRFYLKQAERKEAA